MTFFYARSLVVWTCWLLFADKLRWREIFPVCFFASCLSLVADQLVDWCIPYWQYYGSEPKIALNLLDAFDIYIVVTYLFIQWLPQRQTFFRMFSYWFAWTSFAIAIEYFHMITGHMAHYHGWSYLHSYIADWILFYIFYLYHKIFHFEKLSK
jgi:hypothetical protein